MAGNAKTIRGTKCLGMLHINRPFRVLFTVTLLTSVLSALIPAALAQSTSGSLEFTISGKEHVSKKLSVNYGDNLLVDYMVESENGTGCLSITVDQQLRLNNTIPVYRSQTPIMVNAPVHRIIPINVTGSVALTFSPCSNVGACMGTFTMSADYGLQISAKTSPFDPIVNTALVWIPIVTFLVGLIIGYVIFQSASSPSESESPAQQRLKMGVGP